MAQKKDPAAEAAAKIWDNMDMGQLEILSAAAENGTFEQALREIAPDLDIEAAGGADAIKEKLAERSAISYKEALSGTVDEIKKLGAALLNTQEAQKAIEGIKETAKRITAYMQSDEYKAAKESLQQMAAYIREHRADFEALDEATDHVKNLAPFLQEELAADPNFEGVTLKQVIREGFTIHGQPTDSKYRPLIERAEQQLADFEATEGAFLELEQAASEIEHIQYKQTPDLKTITDKLTNIYFSLTAPQPRGMINGQRQMLPVRYEGKKSKKEITLFFDYTWNEETLKKYGLDKSFTDFDFFVMTALDNLKGAGNDIVSATKIYREMGGEGSPGQKHLQEISDSLLKGATTIITIDNKEVLEAFGKMPDKDSKEKYQEIVSQVMPIKIRNERFMANGRIADCYIKILDYSPFLQVAAPINRITTWDKEVLRLYKGKKTKRYYSVLRFLMQQIGMMRSTKANRSPKVLYSTLYEYTGAKTSKAQKQTRDMMYRILDEVFKPAAYILAYKEEAKPNPGVVLTLNTKRQQISAK